MLKNYSVEYGERGHVQGNEYMLFCSDTDYEEWLEAQTETEENEMEVVYA